ncbi:MAG: thioredoxin family protein [Flavobacterium sp.]|uniref:thioredoxin family protein n=1 Tax=Flavobacterium sp. TaxID=239 RepID=UPI0022C2567E|nr:thioredoxin family protein [Flavobacterium sp.]MCZ8197089.1 thioredoxin family protein [Flavobacterium sp.]
MKAFLSFILLVVISFSSKAQEYQQVDSLFAKAKSENKKVLLYFSGSDWCAPCIRFKKKYIENADFKEFAKNNLIVYNADFPRKKNNQLNKEIVKFNEELADNYNKTGAFPKIILLDFNGFIIKEWLELPTESIEEFIKNLK